jgi:hypothetical protein
MSTQSTRRRFLQNTAAATALTGLGDMTFLSALPTVSAAETKLPSTAVRFDPDIEPLVRLIEDTPRDKLLEAVAAKITTGTTYREVLAALLLAGIRNVQPRPIVGFKFHSVLVVNSAHLASMASPDADRWLPIFWALDHFKGAQANDVREGDWTMARPDEAALPPAHKARDAFIDAMDKWDESAADAAVTSLARSAGINDVFELLYRFGSRDFRDIGHKAIYVANAKRTLDCIGHQHAEPVVRSLAYALLKRDDKNPAQHDLPPDRPWQRHLALVDQFPATWTGGKPDKAATADLLAVYRDDSDEDATNQVISLIEKGVSPQTIWDANFAGAAEFLMRQPGIIAIHALTTTNAMHYAYQTAANDQTRRLLLLQNAAFLPMFRTAMRGRGQVGEQPIDQLQPLAPETKGPGAIEEIFADVGNNRLAAARKTLAYLQQENASAKALIDAARTLTFLKGNDVHDYKFSSALLEDYHHASPTWRNRYLAAGTFLLESTASKDNTLVKRTRDAFQT